MIESNEDAQAGDGEDFEEITSEEVDQVIAQLEKVMATVTSENIKSYLEEAINNIFFLVYEEEEFADAA